MSVPRCCAPVLRRVGRDDDTAQERTLKEHAVPVALGCTLVFGLLFVGKFTTESWTYVAGIGLAFCGASFVSIYAVLARRLPASVLTMWVLSGCVATALADWGRSAVAGDRVWSYQVIVLDAALVLNLAPCVSQSVMVFTVVWLTLLIAEDAWRFGLSDILEPDMASVEERWYGCGDPPCAVGLKAFSGQMLTILVCLCVDFWFTRSFVHSLRSGIRTAQDIAECLAVMDVERAEGLVDGDGAQQLPDEFRIAFRSILHNLKAWRDAEEERRHKLEDERDARNRRIIVDAEEKANVLAHPMVLTPATGFVSQERLMSYEDLRNAGRLVVIDTEDELAAFKEHNSIIFLSHQWLAWGIPDPDNLHHRTMQRAVLKLAEMYNPSLRASSPPPGAGRLSPQQLTRSATLTTASSAASTSLRSPDSYRVCGRPELENVYVWVDFASIAQKHRGMQAAAVAALPLYASHADSFVVVAPRTLHAGTRNYCDLDTYNMRGWCRAEMLSKVCGSGLRDFFILQDPDGDVEPVTAALLDRLSLSVFDGDFSCCALGHRHSHVCDKETLMPAVLGLYSRVLASLDSPAGSPRRSPASSPRSGRGLPALSPSRALFRRRSVGVDPAVQRMLADKVRFFPPVFTFQSCEGWEEERELFGSGESSLVELMEQHVKGARSPGGAGKPRRSELRTASPQPDRSASPTGSGEGQLGLTKSAITTRLGS